MVLIKLKDKEKYKGSSYGQHPNHEKDLLISATGKEYCASNGFPDYVCRRLHISVQFIKIIGDTARYALTKGEQQQLKQQQQQQQRGHQGQSLSIGIQLSKKKIIYIGRNVQNLKKLVPRMSCSTLSL